MDTPSPGLTIHQDHPLPPFDGSSIVRLLSQTAEAEGHQIGEVGVILAGHALVHELNRTHLQHDYITDVLSFPLHEPGDAIEGEIYVDVETAQERFAEFGTSLEAEVLRYVVHGFLHLLGYDDATPEEREAMRLKEDRYLQQFT